MATVTPPGDLPSIRSRPGPGTPLRVEPARWRITAVIPCFNRPQDAQRLLDDLARQHRHTPPIDLRTLLLDNASDQPLHDAIRWPEGLRGGIVRASENRGGAGGFNVGMRRALASEPASPRSALWLLDSDARLHQDALARLADALERHPDLCAAGSALADPETGECFELGGLIDRRTGEYLQPTPAWGDRPPDVLPVEYLAACSLLVRREAVERAGLMPEVFLNGDDVAWCLDLRRRTGFGLAGVPGSIAYHPRPDRMRTGARYYAARNAFDAIDRAGLGPRARFVRAIREVGRAGGQTLIGRDDLAELHLRGLADAIARRTGRAPEGTIAFEPFHTWEELEGEGLGETPARVERADEACTGLEALLLVVRRLVGGIERDLALVSARGRSPREWLAARTLVVGDDTGYVIRRIGEGERAARLARVLGRGARLAARLALRPPRPAPIVPAVDTEFADGVDDGEAPGGRAGLSLSVVVLSYNRKEALRATLTHLCAREPTSRAEIIVVDNASTDGSAEMAEREFEGVRPVRLERNAGVAGFNRGAELAMGDVLLILDDDARPEEGALDAALRAMERDPAIGAVPLLPRHPATRRAEWSFADRAGACDDWPVMGCGNLVRAAAWRMAGGYEAGYFLYRNDADLAMSLLEAGWKVHFDPGWVVWHDSPQAKRKSLRWFETATRNWIWMCRRHGRGLSGAALAAIGWLWAHKEAGLDARAHRRAVRGAWAGVRHGPPAAPGACQGTGFAARRLLGLRLGRRGRNPAAPGRA